MIFVGKDALLQGMGILESVQSAAESLSDKIERATQSQGITISLILINGRPVNFSDGEYIYIRSAAVLIIRINRDLELEERVRIFFRELAEFLQRCEKGYCFTQEVWEKYAPMEYNTVKEMLDVQAF